MRAPGGSATFHYRAAMPDGSILSGQLSASDKSGALGQLRQLGAVPMRLETEPLRDSWLHREVGWSSSKSLSTREAAQFCRELAILTKAGLEVPDALESILSSDQQRSRLARFCTSVLQGVRLGKGFAAAVEQSGFKLPRETVPTLRAGETAGVMPSALASLADALDQRSHLAGSVLNAIAYPVFLLGVVAVVIAIIGGLVAPPLGRLFISMNRPPPAAIQLLWSTSEFIGAQPLFVVLMIGIVVALGIGVAITSWGQQTLRNLVRPLPVIGGLLLWSSVARFGATLKLSLATNVALPVALQSALDAAGGISQRGSATCVAAVRRGTPLHTALKDAGNFPPKALHLISIGEKSGRLGDTLTMVVEEAAMQVGRRTSLIETLLGPILIVLVGTLVGVVVFSIFSALMEINNFAS